MIVVIKKHATRDRSIIHLQIYVITKH